MRLAEWLVLTLAAALTSGCWGGCGGVPSGEPGRSAFEAVVREGYVGSEACAPCHARETAAWTRSRHHNVFRTGADPAYIGTTPSAYQAGDLKVSLVSLVPREEGASGDAAERRAQPAGREATVRQRPGMQVEGGGVSGAFPVDAVIGGGRMEVYATHLPDGAWLLLPLQYQIERRAFADYRDGTCGIESIGLYTPTVWQAYERVWNHRCIECHVTAGAIGFDPAKEKYASTWVETGVGCEACHGPGQAHVAAAKRGRGSEGIINPGALPRRAAAEICASCHALAYPFESRWGGNRPWRPGEDYLEAYLPLLRSTEAPPFTKLAHADHTPAIGVMEYQGLLQSLCALRGNATCTTCHDAHGAGEAPHSLKADPDSLCSGCHGEVATQGVAHTHHLPATPGGACVDCHMPPTITALGTRLANHAIDVPIPANNVDFKVPDACTQCHRERGAEWAARSWRRWWGSPEDLRRRRLAKAFAGPDATALRMLLADGGESDLLRADAATALARVAGREAAGELVHALREDASLLVRRHAADLLGSLSPNATASLDDRARQRAALEAAGVFEALRHAVASGPGPLRLGAAASLARLGTDDGIARLESLRSDPILNGGYRLHAALGKYYLLVDRRDEAAAEYERVLSLTPNYLTAIKDLGFIYFTTQRFKQAHDVWMRGLVLNPFDEEMKLNVHLAEDEMRAEDTRRAGGAAGAPGSAAGPSPAK